MVPVGPETLGRIINVIGEPIDERGPINAKKYYPIHRDAPSFQDQGSGAELLITGIKVKLIYFRLLICWLLMPEEEKSGCSEEQEWEKPCLSKN